MSNWKVAKGVVHKFSGKRDSVCGDDAYDCGMVKIRLDTKTSKPVTCKNCLWVIATKKRRK